MKFDFFMPVKIFSGKDCVKQNGDKLILGTKCFFVTGRRSAVLSGALEDATAVLKNAGIEYTVFNEVMENPLCEMCYEGGKRCREFGADFIVAIGGGSAIDAAKAIAAYATNPEAEPAEIFDQAENPGLPIVAIPTTAGTGSEANPYSVLTLPGGEKKKTFKSAYTYPTVAFLDPRYTYSLNPEYTVSTALDALAHCIESYLSPKSTDISRMFAAYGAKNIWKVLFCNGNNNEFSEADREALMYASCAGGIAINQTGTGFPHPLGYSLTLLDGIPHGCACAVFEGEYLAYNARDSRGESLIRELAEKMRTTPLEMREKIVEKSGVKLTMTEEEIQYHVDLVAGAGNYANSPYVIKHEEMLAIYRKLFG